MWSELAIARWRAGSQLWTNVPGMMRKSHYFYHHCFTLVINNPFFHLQELLLTLCIVSVWASPVNLLMLWMDSRHHEKNFYIGRSEKEIDARLHLTEVPGEISRAPRSIADRNHWKASEWRAFIF